MLLLIVALFWLAIGIPWGVSKYRNAHADRSIDTFQAEHEVLSRQGYTVAPARRLDDAYLYEEQAYEPAHPPTRPRLTVVHDDDTYSSLESRLSWDEWERDYAYDDDARPAAVAPAVANHRFAAYASSPTPTHSPSPYDTAPLASMSMKARRQRIALGLVSAAVVLTLLEMLVGAAALQDLAIVAWVALAAYVAAALVAISQGYLGVSSLIGGRVRAFAPIELHGDVDHDDYVEEMVDEDDEWAREPRRYALG